MKLDVHLGALLEARVQEIGMSKAEFARRMNVERQTVNAWWGKESFDVKLLLRAGEVLGIDILAALLQDPNPEPAGKRGKFMLLLEVDGPQRDALLEELS